MPQTLTGIRSLLADFGLNPKSRYGQNFLHDGNMMRKIIHAADIRPGELILEVGPGTGALTGRLLDTGADVIAVEIDRRLEPLLRHQFRTDTDGLWLIFEDILIGKRMLNPRVMELIGGRAFKLVANLPYNVASPLLVNLAAHYSNMSHAIAMIQEEVAARIMARPGGKDYGQLSVMIQAMCEIERVVVLPPSCFWPMPKVSSAVIRLTRRDQPLTDQPDELDHLLHILFSKRRKQLGGILGRQESLPEGVEPHMRPDSLSVQQIISLLCHTDN